MTWDPKRNDPEKRAALAALVIIVATLAALAGFIVVAGEWVPSP